MRIAIILVFLWQASFGTQHDMRNVMASATSQSTSVAATAMPTTSSDSNTSGATNTVTGLLSGTSSLASMTTVSVWLNISSGVSLTAEPSIARPSCGTTTLIVQCNQAATVCGGIAPYMAYAYGSNLFTSSYAVMLPPYVTSTTIVSTSSQSCSLIGSSYFSCEAAATIVSSIDGAPPTPFVTEPITTRTFTWPTSEMALTALTVMDAGVLTETASASCTTTSATSGAARSLPQHSASITAIGWAMFATALLLTDLFRTL